MGSGSSSGSTNKSSGSSDSDSGGDEYYIAENSSGKLSETTTDDNNLVSAVNEIGSATATASASKLGSKAKALYNALANSSLHYSDGSIKETWANSVVDAYGRGEISASDAKFLLQTGKFI